jgi:hypothetical protein
MVYNILAALFFAHYLIEVFGLPYKLKKIFKIHPDKRIKPFDCNYCLSGWLGLVFFLLPLICSQVAVVLFGSAYLSKYIK